MLAVLISWILILFVFLSFGNIFASLYKSVCRSKAMFSVPDTFMAGMCSVTLLVSLLTFLFPANHHVLLVLVGISTCYTVSRRKQIGRKTKEMSRRLKSFSLSEKVIISTTIASFLLMVLWSGIPQYDSFDSLYYHMSFIRWHEEFPLIPGLANFEERFGFNSNYLLLSAPFTLRFLFNDPIFGIQSLTAVIIMLWIFSEIIRSDYEIKRVFLLFVYSMFIYLCRHEMALTSTDILPNLLAFYLGAKAILHPQEIGERHGILFIMLPVYIVTLKLSYAFVSLAGFILLFNLVKRKEYRALFFCLIVSSLILAPWLVRNVVISGYLIYPLTAIDLFAVDWKVPKEIADAERHYIYHHVRNMYSDKIIDALKHFRVDVRYSWHLIVSGIAGISLIVSILALFKNKVVAARKTYISIACIILAGVLYLGIAAPAVRFGYGYITSIIFLAFCLTVPDTKLDKLQMILDTPRRSLNLLNGKTGTVIAMLIVLPLWISSYKNINKQKRFYHNYCNMKKSKALHKTFFKPVSATEAFMHVDGDESKQLGTKTSSTGLIPHKLSDDITIYVSAEDRGFLFDIAPAVPDRQRATGSEWIFQDYRDLEARGTSICDGFRSKLNKR